MGKQPVSNLHILLIFSYGQLGNGGTTSTYIPIQVGGDLLNLTVAQVACGTHHAMVITSNATAFIWGNNGYKQVGDGTTTDRTLPFQIYLTGLIYKKRTVHIAGGQRHTVILAADGVPYGVGDCFYYQFGTCPQTVMSPPFIIAGLTGKRIVRVAAGTLVSHFLDSTGDVYGVGYNSHWAVSTIFKFT